MNNNTQSSDNLQTIINRISIVELIQEHLTLTKKGRNYMGICPFHDDNHPSLVVNEQKQIFKCFSCGVGGNIFQFLILYKKITFKEALKILAEKAGVKIKIGQSTAVKIDPKITKIWEINQKFTQYFVNFLFSDHPSAQRAQEYLKKRSLTTETIMEFKVGYCPNRILLEKFWTSQDYSLNELEESGILLVNNDNQIRCLFENRIVFPIIDQNQNIIGFSARTLNKGIVKYINTPERPTFIKSQLFFNEKILTDPKFDWIIITEGYFDVMALVQNQISNSVGLMGTNCSTTLIAKIKNHQKRVILWLDADPAGQKATLKISQQLLKNNIKVKIASLKDQSYDPAELILEKKINFKIIKQNLLHPFNFACQHYQNDLKQKSNEIGDFIKHVRPYIVAETNLILKNNFVQQLAQLVKQPLKIVQEYLNLPKPTTWPKRTSKNDSNPKTNIIETIQERFIWLSLMNKKQFLIIQKVMVNLKKDFSFNPKYQACWEALTDYYVKKQRNCNIIDMMTSDHEKIFGKIVAQEFNKIFKNNQHLSSYLVGNQEIEDCIIGIKRFQIQEDINSLKNVQSQSTSKTEKIKISQKISYLKKNLYQIDS